jgi:hypothetical protein
MANYDSAKKDINKSGTGYYIDPASSSMSCDKLKAGIDFLTPQIALWNDRYNQGNSKEKANISVILQVQNQKLNDYVALYRACGGTGTIPTTSTGGILPSNPLSTAINPLLGNGNMQIPATGQTTGAGLVNSALGTTLAPATGKMPSWIWWAIGGVAVVGIVIAVAKK